MGKRWMGYDGSQEDVLGCSFGRADEFEEMSVQQVFGHGRDWRCIMYSGGVLYSHDLEGTWLFMGLLYI